MEDVRSSAGSARYSPGCLFLLPASPLLQPQAFPISCWELTGQPATSVEEEAHEDLWVCSGHTSLQMKLSQLGAEECVSVNKGQLPLPAIDVKLN